MKRLLWLVVLAGLVGCAGVFETGMAHVQRISWRQQVLRQLDSLWAWSLEEKTEEAYCLYGMQNITGTAVFVREARAPLRELSLRENTATVRCQASEEFLGIAHTHPSGQSEPSKTDLAQLDEVSLIVVVCGPACRTSWLAGHVAAVERVN